MATWMTGDSSVFAIESSITRAYERLGQRALGFFAIYIAGNCYGVRAPEASLLACSLDAVQRRIARRGLHSVSFGADAEAIKLAEAVIATTYDEDTLNATFFGMSSDEFRHALQSAELLWAPDGDAAFDDGGHVLQFDVDNQVRLIAFMNPLSRKDGTSSMAEIWTSAENFYGCLDKWQRQFEVEWAIQSKNA